MKKLNLKFMKSVGIFSFFLLVTIWGCDKENDTTNTNTNNNNTNGTTDKMLIIENGAQTVEMEGSGSGKTNGSSITYSAKIVDDKGNESTATVTWSSSDEAVVTISSTGGGLTIAGSGSAKITASATVDGVTYTASVPISIVMPSVFVVVPGSVIMMPADTLTLTPVFFTTESSVSYSYSSADAAIAKVNSAGMITGVAAGFTEITVAASTSQGSPIYIVPVLVISEPEVVLPVVEVKITPFSADLFKNDTKQFSAKAYNSDGVEVSETFTWVSLNDTIATVDANGLVTAVDVGNAYIQAIAKGVIGQAEVMVSPDTVVILNPFWTDLGAGAQKQFTATAYDARNMTKLSSVTTFNWELPDFGPGFEIFNIATVDANGLVTMKQDATVGMMTFLLGWVPGSKYAVGVSTITASFFSSDCGTGNSSVTSIDITNGSTIDLNFTSNPTGQVNAIAKDAGGNTVSSPALKYISDDTAVVIVDADTGELTAMGMGTATVTVCSGSYASATVTVNVSF